MENNKERFEQLGTKIDPAVAEVLNACCDALHVDVYHLLQWFAYVIVKAAAPMHGLDPRIQKLMTLLDIDAGWQNAFNLANPDNLRIAQVILILEQEGHTGFGAVMIDHPWMGKAPDKVDDLDPHRADPQMTENVDTILERTLEVTMSGIYRRLRLLGAKRKCDNFSDVLLDMLENEDSRFTEENFFAEMPQMGDIAPNGKPLAYGKRAKRKKHFTPDTMPTQASLFGDIDHSAPAPELEDLEGEWTEQREQSDARINYAESRRTSTEGQRVNRNLNAELSRGHVDDD